MNHEYEDWILKSEVTKVELWTKPRGTSDPENLLTPDAWPADFKNYLPASSPLPGRWRVANLLGMTDRFEDALVLYLDTDWSNAIKRDVELRRLTADGKYSKEALRGDLSGRVNVVSDDEDKSSKIGVGWRLLQLKVTRGVRISGTSQRVAELRFVKGDKPDDNDEETKSEFIARWGWRD